MMVSSWRLLKGKEKQEKKIKMREQYGRAAPRSEQPHLHIDCYGTAECAGVNPA
jgi:hypothetical protein